MTTPTPGVPEPIDTDPPANEDDLPVYTMPDSEEPPPNEGPTSWPSERGGGDGG